MAIMRLTNHTRRGEPLRVLVEEFVTHASQLALADDLEQEGLHREALVVRSTARTNKKRGKQAWWQLECTLHPADLPNALWRVWGAMHCLNRKSVLACIY